MIRFESPSAFIFVALWILVWYYFYTKRMTQAHEITEKLGEIRTFSAFPFLTIKNLKGSWFRWLIIGGLFGLALANPQWGSKKTQGYKNSSIVLIVLDISNSMLCGDMPPSRLDIAKQDAINFIKKEAGNKLCLIFFAGTSFVQMPITDDIDAAVMLVESATPEQIITQGSNLGEAIDMGISLLSSYNNVGKSMVIFSDGEEHDNKAIQAAKDAASENIVIHSIGYGTDAGGPIVIETETGVETKTDESGNPVVTKLESATLKAVAAETNGKYLRASDYNSSSLTIHDDIASQEKILGETNQFEVKQSYFWWFILLALILIFYDKYKREKPFWITKTMPLTLILMIFSFQIMAQSPHQLLRGGDKAYGKKSYEEALKKYESASTNADPNQADKAKYNQGNAQYQLQKYDEALKLWEGLNPNNLTQKQQSQWWYNKGNAHYQKQAYPQAADAYKQALKINPKDFDAKLNLAITNRKMQQQQQQQQQKQQDQQQQKDQQDKNQKSQNNNQDQKQDPSKDPSKDKKEQEQKDNKQKESPKNQEQKDQQQKEKQDQEQQQSSNTPKTSDHIKQLLKIAEQEEKKTQAKLRRGNPQSKSRPEKDW